MSREKMLFIGGIRDGERIEVVAGRKRVQFVAGTAEDDSGESYVFYTRRQLAGDSSRFEVFVVDGLSGDEVVRRLVDNYRPKN